MAKSKKPKAVRMTIQVDGVREALRAIGRLPKTAQAEIRDAAGRIAETEAGRIRSAAKTKQQRLAAQSVRARRDRVPVIIGGGSKKLPGQKRTYGDLFFGAEFGGGARPRTHQFQPHKGTEGYFFWPTLRDDETKIFDEWSSVVDAIAREWER